MGEIAPVLPVAVEEQEGRSRPLRGVMQRNISHAAPSKAKQRFAAKSFSFSLPFSLYTKKKEGLEVKHLAVIARVAAAAAVYAIDKPYDYLVPAALEERAKSGVRVTVPFGRA